MIKLRLPHNEWTPRPHQMALWRYLHEGGKRAIAIWHRRAGKDDVCLHHAAVSAASGRRLLAQRCPSSIQARKAVWAAVNPHTGKRRIHEAFPSDFIENMDDHAMFMRFKNGSTFQIIGSDLACDGRSSIGAGVTYSEYALSNPSAWAYHRPMLAENNGWACSSARRAVATTPTMYDYALKAPGWFAERLTVNDTDALTPEQQRETLAEMQALYGNEHGEAMYKQEYECDCASALLGRFYALEMQHVREEGRILECEPIEGVPALAWDLGVSDDTSILVAGPAVRTIVDLRSLRCQRCWPRALL